MAHRKYGCISSVFGSAKAEVFSPLQAVFEAGKKVWQVFWDGGGQRVSPGWQVTTRTSGLNSAKNKFEFARYLPVPTRMPGVDAKRSKAS
jgi:hypothetical protein